MAFDGCQKRGHLKSKFPCAIAGGLQNPNPLPHSCKILRTDPFMGFLFQFPHLLEDKMVEEYDAHPLLYKYLIRT